MSTQPDLFELKVTLYNWLGCPRQNIKNGKVFVKKILSNNWQRKHYNLNKPYSGEGAKTPALNFFIKLMYEGSNK